MTSKLYLSLKNKRATVQKKQKKKEKIELKHLPSKNYDITKLLIPSRNPESYCIQPQKTNN